MSSRVEDAPQKPNCRSSPEHMNSRTTPVLEACSPYARVRRNRDRDDREEHNSSELGFLVLSHLSRTRGVSLLCSTEDEDKEMRMER